MKQRQGIREVAEFAGVSIGTVSNVLNRPSLVAEETRTRVREAMRQLGFVRDESARQLRAGRSRMIGLVVLDVANPFFTDVARGVEDYADATNTPVILCNSDEDPGREERYLDLLEEQRIKGILITPVNQIHPRLQQLRDRGIPVVLLDRRATRKDQCSVAVDDIAGGSLAMTHLLERGHRRIAFVGGSDTITQARDRQQGALNAIEARGLKQNVLQVYPTPNLNFASGVAAARQILQARSGRRITAVLCANDLLALGVLQQFTRTGVRVPDDVALVGYDDIDFAAAAAIPLSSVRQPRHRLGHAAAELLLKEADGEKGHVHQQVVFEPELIVRASSDTSRNTRATARGRTIRGPAA